MSLKDLPTRSGGTAIVLSLAAHAALLTLFIAAMSTRVFVIAREHDRRLTAIEVAGAARRARILMPAAPSAMDVPQQSTKWAQPRPLAQTKQAAGRPDAIRPDLRGKGTATSGTGSDAEDASPAFPVFAPKPPVTDRTLLPLSAQKIVVDVKLNEAGRVVSESLIRGLGNRLDGIAMQVVMTWRFQPATLNGKPVASEAEVIFPFDRSYPVSEP